MLKTAKTTTTFLFARATETPSDDKAAVFKDIDDFGAIVPWGKWSIQLRMGGWQAPTAKWLASIAREVSGDATNAATSDAATINGVSDNVSDNVSSAVSSDVHSDVSSGARRTAAPLEGVDL